ncbi:MAG: phytanoyl-CoA dioxygenase family protein [Gemmatimonadetes bacterium]|nr:phytanoyl-CoA dioxygenase family protein [Gemmatimonadota bacterium]MYK53498.1 phytanoyl-CoA dioxygenase family protein [Gemmatimonadota bacterium]
MLSDQQKAYFDTFGFLALRRVFSSAEMKVITAEAESLWREDLQTRLEATSYQAIVPFIERRPILSQLPRDDRIWKPIEDLLGPGFVWGQSEGNRGSFNETNNHEWHSDRAGQIDLNYTRIKIMIYLQKMDRDTGALRVIPGSHLPHFHCPLLALQPQTSGTSMDVFAVRGNELPGYILSVKPGDLIFFNQYLYHAVYDKQEGRSYIAMKFAARPQTPVHYEALCKHNQGADRLHDHFRNSDHPRIRAMVKNLLAWERQP